MKEADKIFNSYKPGGSAVSMYVYVSMSCHLLVCKMEVGVTLYIIWCVGDDLLLLPLFTL